MRRSPRHGLDLFRRAPRWLAHRGFAFRLACITSALIVAACVTVSWILLRQGLEEIQRGLVERGRTISDYVAREAELSVISGNVAALAQLAKVVATQTDVAYCTFLDARGEVLSSFGERPTGQTPATADASPIDTQVGVLEFQAAISTTGAPPRREELEFGDAADGAVAAAGQERIGTVAIGMSLAPLAQRRQLAFATAASLTFAVALVGVLCAALFARAVTRPLQALAAAADTIARGDLSAKVRVSSHDEVAAVAASFNGMVTSLAENRATLEEYSSDLEIRSQRLEAMNRDLVVASDRLRQEIVERELAQQKLEELHKQLLTVSRQAGMAEVATGVLHNIGNALNSANVSATLIESSLKDSRISGLGRGLALIRRHQHDLASFLAHDPKGTQLPAYLEAVNEHLLAERAAALQEAERLRDYIAHIRRIVAAQQSHATFGGATEPVDLDAVTEDALRLSTASLTRRQIEVVREFESIPTIVTDRHRVLGILMNLVGNAAHALDERPSGRRLVLRISRQDAGHVAVRVGDNGTGIPAENLNRIFTFGFTTKQNGHGFGLHSSANAAAELGGRLTVHSEGLGHGATFTLELPVTGEGQHTTPAPSAQPHEQTPAG